MKENIEGRHSTNYTHHPLVRLAVSRSVCSLGRRDRKNPQHDSGAKRGVFGMCREDSYVVEGFGFGVGEVGSDQGSCVLLIDVSLSGEGCVATCGRVGEV